MFKLTAILLLLTLTQAVSFQSLYNRQLKSSYGFEILKHYHSQQFGNEDVKKFKGQSMLFLAPWYSSNHLGEHQASSFQLSTSKSLIILFLATTTSRKSTFQKITKPFNWTSVNIIVKNIQREQKLPTLTFRQCLEFTWMGCRVMSSFWQVPKMSK